MKSLTASKYFVGLLSKLAIVLLIFGTPVSIVAKPVGRTIPNGWDNTLGHWIQDPLFMPVSVAGTNINGGLGSTVTITISDVEMNQSDSILQGIGADTPTNTAPHVFSIKPHKEYSLTIVATDLSSMELTFSFQPNWTTISRTGRKMKPKEYRIFVDRVIEEDKQIEISGTSGAYSNTWIIELSDQLPGQSQLDDSSGDPNPAPGDGGWAEIGPGKSLQTNETALSWNVSLGRLKDGMAAGRLGVRQKSLSRQSYTSSVLTYSVSSVVVRDAIDLIPIADTNSALRQVKAYQTFVDIVNTSTNETELRFYLPSQVGVETNSSGLYTNITGTPYVVWMLSNPEPSTVNKLNIVEKRNGLNYTNAISFTPDASDSVWSLRYGSGAEERVETRTINFSYSPKTNRVETVDVRYAGAGTPSYRAKETYQQFPWGFELVETRIDPDNDSGTDDDLVTSVTFYDDPGDPASYGQGATTVNPDGSWEKRIYNFSYFPEYIPLAILRPFKGSPSSPDVADPSNSTLTRYGQFMTDIYTSYPPYDEYTSFTGQNWTRHEFRQNWVDNPFEGEEDVVGGVSYLKTKYDFLANEACGLGLAKHPLGRLIPTGEPSQVCFYNAVTYHPEDNTYDVDPDSDQWAQSDWRGSTIFLGDPNSQTYSANWFYVTGSDGQPLYDPYDIDYTAFPPALEKGQSTLENCIYHNGSMVLKEKSVFTGGEIVGNRVLDIIDIPEFDPICKWIYQNDSLGHATNITWVDSASSVSRVIYSADYRGTNDFDGELKLWEMDETGKKTFFYYDSLKRLVTTKLEGVSSGTYPAQADIVTNSIFDASGRKMAETNSAGSLVLSCSWVYDLNGRIISQTDTNGLTTTFSYDLSGRRTTKTLPNGATEITENYIDGHLKSKTGTGIVAEYHDWELHSIYDGSTDDLAYTLPLHETIHYGATDSSRVEWNWYDQQDRLVINQKPDFSLSGTNSEYTRYSDWKLRQLPVAKYKVNYGGDMIVTVLDYQRDSAETNSIAVFHESKDALWYGGTDIESLLGGTARISRAPRRLSKVSGNWFEATTNVAYQTDNSDNETVKEIKLERLNGFSDGNVLSEIRTWDAFSNLTTDIVSVDRGAKKSTEIIESAHSTLKETNIVVNGLLESENTHTISSPTLHFYDELTREIGVQTPLGFTTGNKYDTTTGRIIATTNSAGYVTQFEFYNSGSTNAGNLKCRIDANGKRTRYEYSLRNQQIHCWGDVPYPEEREYSDYNELIALHTYRGNANWNDSTWPASPGDFDTTTWKYQAETGLLTNKVDSEGRAVGFTYTNNMVWTRTWARGVITTNAYNDFGDLRQLDYSDGTPSVNYENYNRMGLPTTIDDATGTHTITYDILDRLITDFNSTNGVTITNHYNSIYGRDYVGTIGLSDSAGTAYSYNSLGKVQSVSSGALSNIYNYVANSDLVGSITNQNGTTNMLVTTKQYQYGYRLTNIVNFANGTNVSSHGYVYDNVDRRTSATREDGSHWDYGYNDRNEVISGKKKWLDGAYAAGQQFTYAFDNIGNRTNSTSGGNQWGNNLRLYTYGVNGLNEYTGRTVPGAIDVIGSAISNSTVTVNDQATTRHADYFRGEPHFDNTGGPVYAQIVTWGAQNQATNDLVQFETNHILLPQFSETITYDEDGNLLSDGLWNYKWDGENRLVQMTNIASVPDAAKKKLVFTYDCLNRRATKAVYNWNTSSNDYILNTNIYFIYDGYNLLAESIGTNLLRCYSWGLDLSGTENGAAGIGGLLLIKNFSPNANQNFVCYGGAGNISALVDASSAALATEYEYGPFGEKIRATSVLNHGNPFGFSTKYSDEETGLICYPARYYNPTLGRWIGRDSMGEQAGVNLLAFLHNNSISSIDPLGHFGLLDTLITDTGEASGEAVELQRGESLITQVRNSIDGLNHIQQFEAGLEDAQGLDATDLLVALENAKGAIAGGLKGAKTAAKAAEDLHHIFPQAGMFADFFSQNKLNPDGVLAKMDRAMHQFGVHRPGTGGEWNKIWKDFMEKNKKMTDNPYYVIGFGAGLFEQILPYIE